MKRVIALVLLCLVIVTLLLAGCATTSSNTVGEDGNETGGGPGNGSAYPDTGGRPLIREGTGTK